MKLPFDLGVKLFFRLLLPGFFLTLGFWPCILVVLHQFQLDGQQEAALVLAVVLLGWVVITADMPVYMLLEGRKFWPTRIWRRLLEGEQERLRRINERIDRFFAVDGTADPRTRRDYLEASVEFRAFPIGADGVRYAEFPTRLGNTIAAFESYPESRYGLDAIFYWPRIWVNLDKDLREELDNQQAIADSAVYSSFALGTAGTIWLAYAVITLLAPPTVALLERFGWFGYPAYDAILRYLPSPLQSLIVSGLAFAAAALMYRLAIFANEQFGTVFMAVVDSKVRKVKSDYVDVEGLATRIAELTKMSPAEDDKLEIVRRYLQYYTVKLPSRRRAVPFPQVERAIADADTGSRQLPLGQNPSTQGTSESPQR
jgi:hypothetical protein